MCVCKGCMQASSPGWPGRVQNPRTHPAPSPRSPISSDRAPRGLDTWRVLLPSRPGTERVARLVPHENASWDDAADLALLQLRAPVNLSTAPRPVCLPYPEHYFLPGSRCRLARWGRGGERGSGLGAARPDAPAVLTSSPFCSQTRRPAPARSWRPSCWTAGGVIASMAARGRRCRRPETRRTRCVPLTRRRKRRDAAGCAAEAGPGRAGTGNAGVQAGKGIPAELA